jgi:4'-phosphopantetheinyl transferase
VAGKARVTLEQKPWPGNLGTRVRALASPDARIELFWGDLAPDAGVAAMLSAWLSPDERTRAARFGTDALRERYVIGRGTLRAALGRRVGVPPEAVGIARGRRGRPQLRDHRDLDFNVSHTDRVMLIAIAHGPTVGVDVERRDRVINTTGIARRCLTDPERRALAELADDDARRRVLQLWTCKEAMSKATGDAMSAPFARLDVAHAPGLRLCDGPPPYVPDAWALHEIAAPEAFFATLAVWSPARMSGG